MQRSNAHIFNGNFRDFRMLKVTYGGVKTKRLEQARIWAGVLKVLPSPFGVRTYEE